MTSEENELLTRIGPGTPMGDLFRRYWIPALFSDDLPGPDCPPVRVRLLGEDLVAFRDTGDQIALVEQHCPHRGASLFFGRNEDFQPLKAMMGAWSMAAGLGKIAIVVDDDIDIRDPFQVQWAIAFRMQPAEDIRIMRDTDPITLDPSQPMKDGKPVLPSEQVSSKLGIDATRKHPYPAPSLPPQEHLDNVAANWERYGIREVRR
jgi:3-polyprenyl-4-hydroxybenzoate decarboxylase